MAIHQENFVAIRKLYPRVTERAPSRMEVADPANATERDYRDLLSEANLNFFHREYSIALDNYFALRQKILTQSHPELPSMPGAGPHLAIDWGAAKLDRLLEYSRRTAVKKPDPGDPAPYDLAEKSLFTLAEVTANPAVARWSKVGIGVKGALPGGLRNDARDLVKAGKLDQAVKLYAQAEEQATKANEFELAADLANESAVMLTTYATGTARPAALRSAQKLLTKAESLYGRIEGNLGDPVALDVVRTNQQNLARELGTTAGKRSTARAAVTLAAPAATAVKNSVVLANQRELNLSDLLAASTTIDAKVPAGAPKPAGKRILLLRDELGWKAATTVFETPIKVAPKPVEVGFFTPTGAKTLSLDSGQFSTRLKDLVYGPRVAATTLEELDFYEVVDVNFVAYFVHLYYFVLPIAIGDCYLAMGQYANALAQYRSTLVYPFLSVGIEAPYVWQKMANAYLEWGHSRFRRNDSPGARSKYEFVVRTNGTLPAMSELYQPAPFASVRTAAQEVLKELAGQPHAATNPRVAAAITQAKIKLRYIAEGLDFFGISPDEAPVFRFKYLQSVATYMADSAVEAERTFVSYRSTAENQQIEHIQLESAVDVNQAALAVEQKKLEDAALEVEAAARTREYSETRLANATDAVDEWNTSGRELTSMNAALSWAGNAANDQDIRYTGVQYDGASHDYEGDVEDFFDTVGERKEWLDWELQRNRLERQVSEAAAEVAMTKVREEQAKVRQEVQELSVVLAQKRLDGSREVLEYAESRLFTEDLWFQLAAQLQDLARSYLDAAIYAALLMERAYELEFDRRLNRIRTDYGLGGPAGLLGGDQLKRDIVSFTSDYLEHAQKKNPVRLLISLREEFPSSFAAFIETGVLPFRTDLELFDRRYPGTYRRKIKKLELIVEGLVPLEGASGFLRNNGVCTEWRRIDGAWTKFSRALPVERLVLSSYTFRRDISVFQPSEEMLGLFENQGPQSDWTLELPRSGNNLDYQAISDVKFVVYFDADHSDDLAAHVKTFYPSTGGRSTVLSARFHYPDEYFRIAQERKVDFAVSSAFFAYNQVNPALSAFGVRVVPRSGASAANLGVTVTRVSDDSDVDVTTDADGAVAGAPTTMAPFGAWLGATPIDTWRVTFDDDVELDDVADVQLFFSYGFSYRADGALV